MIFLQSKLFFMLLIGMASLSGWRSNIHEVGYPYPSPYLDAGQTFMCQ